MIIIALIGVVFGLARAIGWGWMAGLVAGGFFVTWVRATIVSGYRSGGPGVFRAMVAGMQCAGGIVVVVSLIVVLRPNAPIDRIDPVAFVLAFVMSVVAGGMIGLIIGGTVALASIILGAATRILPQEPPPPTTGSNSARRARTPSAGAAVRDRAFESSDEDSRD